MRMLVEIRSGNKVVWWMYVDSIGVLKPQPVDSDKDILDMCKARAKLCGKQLPKNSRVVPVNP